MRGVAEEFVTFKAWNAYAKFIERTNFKVRGYSPCVVTIARRASAHILDIQDDRMGMIVLPGWRASMGNEGIES